MVASLRSLDRGSAIGDSRVNFHIPVSCDTNLKLSPVTKEGSIYHSGTSDSIRELCSSKHCLTTPRYAFASTNIFFFYFKTPKAGD